MKYLVVYAHENGFGNVDCEFNHNPPKMCDIREVENKIQRINQFDKKPLIINFLEIDDD